MSNETISIEERGVVTCTRRIQFCAGHRVLGHEGKCAHPHGHNYVAFITAHAAQLDAVGRVIDFSVLKQSIGGWIDATWDHGFLFCQEDEEMGDIFLRSSWKHHALEINPTAENMARYLLEVVCPVQLEGTGIEVREVTLWETENCFATVRL